MSQSSKVNEDFFRGSYKEVWKLLIPEGLTEVEVDFLIDIGGLTENAQVLDLMCGYGRHALELAKRGYRVTAIDSLEDYIQEIVSAASADGLSVEAIKGDVLQATLLGPFDLAICMGNSFAFFEKEEATSLLKKICSSLKPGGKLVINSWMIAEIAIKYFKERDWYQVGGYKYLLDYKFEFQPNRIESTQTIIDRNGRTEELKGIDYIFSLDEMSMMFDEAGMEITGKFSTPRKKPFALGDGRIYLVATKNS